MSHRTGHVSASSRQGRPVERVQLGEYYRFIGQSHDDRLHEAGNLDGFTTALDGWASAILLQCDSNDPDPVRRIIEGKRFNADQLSVDVIFFPAPKPFDPAPSPDEKAQFSNLVKNFWTRAQAKTADWDGPSPMAFYEDYGDHDKVCVKLGGHVACPMYADRHISLADFIEDATPAELDGAHRNLRARWRANIPRSSIFFASRLHILRAHAQEILDYLHHQQHHLAAVTQKKVHHVVLQMLLYYHKMVKTESGHAKLDFSHQQWLRNAQHLEHDPIFGIIAFNENRTFLENNQSDFGTCCRVAVQFWIAGRGHEESKREEEVLLKAMDGMKDGLCTVFGVLFLDPIFTGSAEHQSPFFIGTTTRH